MGMLNNIIEKLSCGDFKSLARAISIVENDVDGHKELLRSLSLSTKNNVIGITGPPGAGKSTLTNQMINYWSDKGMRVAVVAVDPTSPFNFGSLLGDRIRMIQQFNKPNVFIRSLATRGSLGGLSVKTIEIIDVIKSSNFDYIIIETVGVGQSEVEIAGLADVTLVVLVPEAGDEIQHIKSGLMEIADIFVVNKSDREGADLFFNNLRKLIHHDKGENMPIVKTVAEKAVGIEELCKSIEQLETKSKNKERQKLLLVEKAWKLITQKRMQDVNKVELAKKIEIEKDKPDFNLYNFVDNI